MSKAYLLFSAESATQGKVPYKKETGVGGEVVFGDAPTGGGMHPEILVTAPTGSTVTVSNGGITLTATESSGTWAFTIPSFGTWTVSATKDTDSATESVSVTEVMQYTVEIHYVQTDLDDNDWDTISAVARAGSGANYWSVGDCKQVALSGTCGTLSLSTTSYVYIIGFNHKGVDGITFQGFKTAETAGTDICLVDANYDTAKSDGTKAFNMNHWGSGADPYNTNFGGWAGCDLRYDVLGSTDSAPTGYGATPGSSRAGEDASNTTATSPVSNTLMSCLPAALRAVMQPMTIYTDNVGTDDPSNHANHITASVDYLPLLAEYEVFGERTDGNEYEQGYQSQYAYYSAGNSKIKNKHNATGTAAKWWLRSPSIPTDTGFCHVSTDGSISYHSSRSSYGLSPIFLV